MYYQTKLKFGGAVLRTLINLLILISISTAAFAQSGKISGKIVDAESGDAVIGCNVIVEGTSIGAAADIDGIYTIPNVPVGNYNLVFTSVGYSKKTVTNVEVKASQLTVIDIVLPIESFETDEVIITAEAAKNTEAGLLVNRQKSNVVSDAISSEQFSRSGASSAADAVKQVVGASIVDGKYVFVRGLGDRYSSTQLNGAELPSSDPNRKAFQMDLLPTNLLDNIVTIKTFTPDKPGNFSGGIVDIGTKNFPKQFTLKVSTSSSYNSYATFNDNNIDYTGVKGNFFGFDDGTRNLPSFLSDPNLVLPVVQQARFDGELAAKLDNASRAFNNVMDFSRGTVPLSNNFAISVGEEIATGIESSFGYLGSVTYSRDHSFYDDGSIGRYILTGQGENQLTPNLLLDDTRSTAESNLGGLANLSYKFSNYHQIHTNLFYTKSGTSETRFMEGGWPQEFGSGADAPIYFNRVLSYTERDIRSLQFSGEHFFESILGLGFDWNVSLSKTTQDEPDRRLITSAEQKINDQVNHIITGSGFDSPSRYFRNLEDNSNTYSFNIKLPFKQWDGKKAEFKVGAFYQENDRSFNERIFTYNIDNRLFNKLDGNITEIFSPQYMGITSIDTMSNGNLRYNFGNTISDNTRLRNQYNGDQKVTAIYGMIDIPIFASLNLVTGVRYETTELSLLSADPTINEGRIDEADLLPSLNIIYRLNDEMNFRAAYTKTLARPTFREIAPFSTKEFVNDVELQGNPNLKRNLITNYDIRWEWFINPGEIFAISGFYKEMENPIELAFAEGSNRSNPIINYVNVPKSTLLGAEFEARVGLRYISDLFSNFFFSGNLSLVESTVDIAGAELQQRLGIDSTASRERQLQGQSPFILNLGINYINYDFGTSVSLDYNVFGERLSKVSANITPDVFEQPVSRLNLNISQKIIDNFTLKFAVKNILNSSYKEVYKYNGQEYIYREYTNGINYSVGISYEL